MAKKKAATYARVSVVTNQIGCIEGTLESVTENTVAFRAGSKSMIFQMGDVASVTGAAGEDATLVARRVVVETYFDATVEHLDNNLAKIVDAEGVSTIVNLANVTLEICAEEDEEAPAKPKGKAPAKGRGKKVVDEDDDDDDLDDDDDDLDDDDEDEAPAKGRGRTPAKGKAPAKGRGKKVEADDDLDDDDDDLDD